jgi:hypothetical protein
MIQVIHLHPQQSNHLCSFFTGDPYNRCGSPLSFLQIFRLKFPSKITENHYNSVQAGTLFEIFP